MKIKILFLLVLLSTSFLGCREKGLPPADPDGGRSKDWKVTQHDNSMAGIWNLPDRRPQEHVTPGGVKVYWDGIVDPRQMKMIDEGITRSLTNCLHDQDTYNPPSGWRDFRWFTELKHFSVILVTPNYRTQETLPLGAPSLSISNENHDTLLTCGTISAVSIVNGQTVQRGGGYLIMPYYTPQDLDNQEYYNYGVTCYANETEHQIFTGITAVFFAYQDGGRDIGQAHPYCRAK